MDNNVYDCRDIIYSENYIDFVINFRRDSSYELSYDKECMQAVNDSYTVAYAKKELFDYLMKRGGYRTVPKCYGLMDMQALEETGTLKLRRQPFINLYGQDVIFGIVDCGIDYRSDVFRKEDGATRIVAAWNQEDANGAAPDGFKYGTEYLPGQIDRALNGDEEFAYIDNLIDGNGHGTAMASVAAGRIVESDDFSGIVPFADIAVVRLKQAKQFYRDYFEINDSAYAFMESDIMLGVSYLVNVSARLGKPIVICLGIGTNQGDHNGSGPLGEYLNSIASAFGIYVCTAAGNEAGQGHHFRGKTLVKEAYQDVEILVGEGGGPMPNKGFAVELWADTAAFFDVRIKPPTGEFSSVVDARSAQKRVFDFRLSGSRAEVLSEIVEKSSGDQLVHIRIETPAAGVWTVRVIQKGSSPGRFDMWLPIQEFLSAKTVFTESDPDVTICEPGNAQNIITFGASSSDGGRIYVNSGRGYTRNGRIKPDFTAPGESVYAVTGTRNGRSVYEYRTGTSIASAVGGGILAMFAEWSIPLVPTGSMAAKQYLIRGADTSNINVPSTSWGWGRINIYDTFVNISE